MKNKIIEILKKYPAGLKAREIAALIPRADRKQVNHILYSNQSEFEVSREYVWKLKNTATSTAARPAPTRKQSPPKQPTSNLSQDEAFDIAINQFCPHNNRYYYIHKWHSEKYYSARHRIINLPKAEFDRFYDNLLLLGTGTKLLGLQIKIASQIADCLEIAMLQSAQVKEIVARCEIINRHFPSFITFSCWYHLALMPSEEFNELMNRASKLRSERILPVLDTDGWIELLSRLNTPEDFSRFDRNNQVINATFSISDPIGSSWRVWNHVVLLPQDQFDKEIQSLIDQKAKTCRLAERDREAFSHETQRKRMQVLEEKEHISSLSTPSTTLAQVCIGDCSTCTRSECIYK